MFLAHTHVSMIKIFGLFCLSVLGESWRGAVLEIRKTLVSFRALRVLVVHQ